MQQVLDFFSTITSSEEIIKAGLYIIVLIVFAENGLFFAFFLPGDYLLFLTGVFGGTGLLKESLSELLIWITIAAILGSLVGYLIGRFAGNRIQNQKESVFFKKKYIDNTQKYFEKYGARTLIISRFLPVIRTFAPILAGISKMKYSSYLMFNVIGAVLWVGILVTAGYYFGEKFPWIVNYVHYIIIFFLAITTFTVVKSYFDAKKELAD
ncbi:MAG: DedA family protein [Bacteroidota bacterium]